MANSSFVWTSFTGGEISQTAQGRFDQPWYRTSLNVCFNGIPLENGSWQRRPGTRHVIPGRAGLTGKLISFTFQENAPYLMEFTDSRIRFIAGSQPAFTNDAQTIVSISSANPAVVTTASPHGWNTADEVMFFNLGANNPLLQGRVILIQPTGSTTFQLFDSITGAGIDGSTLGAFVSGTVSRILAIATSYSGLSWQVMRSVQAETRTALLNGTHPQILQVATQPAANQFATFSLGPADFIDGPYLDPISGSVVSSNTLNGVVTLTFFFASYDSTKAYNIGDFISSGGVGYQSLTALNQNHTPASSPSNWKVVNGGTPVNGGQGFLASDIGRLVRLFSEPQVWNAANTYTTGTIVTYDDGFGGSSYWTATGAVGAGVVPGTSSLWALNANSTVARWTWAQITSIAGTGLVAPQTAIGNLTNPSAAFDGNTGKSFSSSANFVTNILTYPQWSATVWAIGALCQFNGVGYVNSSGFQIVPTPRFDNWSASIAYAIGQTVTYGSGSYTCIRTEFSNFGVGVPPTGFSNALYSSATFWTQVQLISSTSPLLAPAGMWTSRGPMPSVTEDLYIGQHYGSALAIASVTVYPSVDFDLANVQSASMTINLRAKNSAPTSASDGTILSTLSGLGQFRQAITLISSNQTSTWSYVWIEIIAMYPPPLPDDGSHIFQIKIGVSQLQFFSPNVNNGSVITAQLRGPALLYNQTIRTWQLGVYSDTTGWPTCGTYHEGRVWLGGVVSNRFDSTISNGFSGTALDFSPTGPDGTVSPSNAISYTCEGEDTNQILWMTPDQQGIIFGTQAGEWLISAPAQGPLAPANIKAVRVTKIGCVNAEPRRAEHTLLFIQKFSRKIMEYFADVFSGKFSAPNLSERAKHLTVSGIAEIAYQQELAPMFWGRRNDGVLVGATYKRDTLTTSQGPTIIGWHRHLLGSGRRVESIAVGPSHGGNLDSLSLITNDTNSGIRHIEIMGDLLDENFALTDCCFLDDAIVPTSTVVQASGGAFGSLLVNGLWAHNGKTVTAFIAGLDCGDYTVSSGSITVPFGDGAGGGTASGLFTSELVQSFPTLPAFVGFTYNSDGQLVRPIAPADTGAQGGPGFAKIGRQHRASALLFGCVNGSISFGTDFTTLYPAKLRQPNDQPYPVNVLWSGIWRDTVNSLLDYDGMVSWRISRPLPANVVVVGGFDSKADI